MAVSSGVSFMLASISSILIFSGMQMYRQWFSASQFNTVVGGYLGSVLFVLFLTALGNMENVIFGKTFQTKLFPEVILCLVTALFVAGTIHRVCTTTCLLFSLLALYYVNKISQKAYASPVMANIHPVKRKK